MAKKAKQSLYGCPGCGDPTTGSVSQSRRKAARGREYDCCPSCIRQETERRKQEDEPDDDPGPWRNRGQLPRCPECRGRAYASHNAMECGDCGHEWVPEGVYAAPASP